MVNLGTAWSKLRWSLAQRGVAGTMRIALQRQRRGDPVAHGKPLRHPFDERYGVDTSGLIVGGELRSGHKNDVFNTAYYGIAPSRFRGVIGEWIADNTHAGADSYSFIDVGCGKGRAVMMASEYPFRQAIGVELHASLAQVAKANLAIWRSTGRPVCPMRIVCQDATEFPFPQGPCLLYLFNPFAAPVMQQLIASIEAAFNHQPGMLDLIYFNPEKEALLQAHTGFKRLRSGTAPISEEDAAVDLVASKEDSCSIYRWVGIAPGTTPAA